MKLELFIQNVQTIRKEFAWHDGRSKRLSALIYTLEGKVIDIAAIDASLKIIKSSTGMFSQFRGTMALVIATKISLSPSPEEAFNQTLACYNKLKEAKFTPSDFLVIAAHLIISTSKPSEIDGIIQKAREIYEGMRKNRWFSTGNQDYIFSVMLAMSDINPAEGVARIKELYDILKKDFAWVDGNSIQALCQLLTLGGKTDEALEHLRDIRATFKANKIKLDRSYTLPSLGALSLLNVEGEVLANQVLDIQSQLRKEKGFGYFSIEDNELLLYASAIVTSIHTDNLNQGILATASTSLLNLLIAQQMTMMTVIMAAAVVNNSASRGGYG